MDGPVPASPPPTCQRAQAAQRPRHSDDWNAFRPTIERLYRNNKLKLKDVMRIMEREHGFFASEKQYKDRLAAWNVRKNIKAKEAHFMIREREKRAARGKRTAFRVHGQNVDGKRLSRFIRRHGPALPAAAAAQTETEFMSPRAGATPTPGFESWGSPRADARPSVSSPEPEAPSDVICYTPEPDEKSFDTLSPGGDLPSDTQDSRLDSSLDEPRHDRTVNGENEKGRSALTTSDSTSSPSTSNPAEERQPHQAPSEDQLNNLDDYINHMEKTQSALMEKLGSVRYSYDWPPARSGGHDF